jgi:serine/threonine protein kinase/anti-anti-sigma regulatory factor
MNEARKLTLERIDGNGGTLVRLRGSIDADLQTTEFVTNVGSAFIIDLDGVERITSFGVREWVRMLGRVAAGFVGFINCRPIVIAQFNSVVDFGQQGQVISLYVPYLCDACGHEFDELVDLRERFDVAEAEETPKAPCPKCGASGELDDMPENYFSFVRQQGRPRVPDVAARVIAGRLDGAAAPLLVEKSVHGDLTTMWLKGALDGRARTKRVFAGVEGNVLVDVSGLTFVDKDGIQKLVELWRSIEPPPYLARASLSVLPGLAREAGVFGGTLLSIAVESMCGSCKALVKTEVINVETPQGTFVCDRCFVENALSVPVESQRLAADLLARGAPRALTEFLVRHPVGVRPADRAKAAKTHSGAYQILQRLGAGGMAEVFLARRNGIEGFEKRVVLKRMLPALSADESFAKMFLQEARVAARINHPNVVQVYDLGLDEGQYFIAMEYVHGWDLSVVLKAARRLKVNVPIGIACRIIADVCAGLAAAHASRDENGVAQALVHRDVSPHNVLIGVNGVVKITDFGISKVGDSSLQTGTGVVKGKVPYMAPEQLDASFGVVDQRVDTYQAGVVFIEMLLGKSPYHMETDLKSLSAVLRGELPPLNAQRDDISNAVDSIARRAVAVTPSARFGSIREFQQELEAAIVAVEGRAVTSEHVAQWIAGLALSAAAPLEPRSKDDTATELISGRRT